MKLIYLLFELLASTLGKLLSFVWSERTSYFYTNFKNKIITHIYKSRFKHFGKASIISPNSVFKNLCFMQIGNNTAIGARAVLTCFQRAGDFPNPELLIANNVSIGNDCHITCANKIVMEDNVLIGKQVLISDNSHGTRNELLKNTPPKDRSIFSKGEILIEENVWIGDNASILAGVTIGRNSIVGSGAVITKSVPSYSIAVGNPAKVIKLKNSTEK